jgi:4-hydroxythreonine-4-phosphate dehydrogenase
LSLHTEGAAPIAISLGDPSGIGPEIIVKALQDDPILRAKCLIFAPEHWLRQSAQAMGLDMTSATGPWRIENLSLSGSVETGKINQVGGEWAYQSIVAATQAVLQGQARALVTAPIHKEALHLAGHHFPGHTELLAEMAGHVPVRMMLANPELRVVLVSIHLSLRQALDALTEEAIFQTIMITEQSLRRFHMGTRDDGKAEPRLIRPRLAVSGLNPHAGEGGLFGREEMDIIAPAIARARKAGVQVDGPFAPDTIFMRARGLKQYDAVVAMYHDQGLIPVKYLGVEQGVNLTLGLPFVRTSPDHGTAFDIAGQGQADAGSLRCAIQMADQLSTGV